MGQVYEKLLGFSKSKLRQLLKFANYGKVLRLRETGWSGRGKRKIQPFNKLTYRAKMKLVFSKST